LVLFPSANRFQFRALLSDALKLLQVLNDLPPHRIGDRAELLSAFVGSDDFLKRLCEHGLRDRDVLLPPEFGRELLLGAERHGGPKFLVLDEVLVPSRETFRQVHAASSVGPLIVGQQRIIPTGLAVVSDPRQNPQPGIIHRVVIPEVVMVIGPAHEQMDEQDGGINRDPGHEPKAGVELGEPHG
jgi:hypothetical protein